MTKNERSETHRDIGGRSIKKKGRTPLLPRV